MSGRSEILTLLTTLKPTADELADWLMTSSDVVYETIYQLRQQGHTITTERTPTGRRYTMQEDGDGQ